ncbi:MAG TPA: hypothetical protein PLL98_07225 [Bacillota bacterium]|nr:hypothetical protein [Bacillota bacterium]HPL54160.1 hypothetical protein [Bacillota bacterium]
MGGIFIKSKIIIVTKKSLIVYAALLLILVIGLVLLFTLRNNEVGLAASGYTYLRYNDGIYVGIEKTESGDVKAEVTIRNSKIKDIKLIEIPSDYISNNPNIKDEISDIIYTTIKSQNVAAANDLGNSSYVMGKVIKAVRNALNESLIN